MTYATSTGIPLSPYQRDIWNSAMPFPDIDQYTIFSYIQFSSNIDEGTLEAAMICAAQRSDVFRLRLNEEDGTPLTSGSAKSLNFRSIEWILPITLILLLQLSPGCKMPSVSAIHSMAVAWLTLRSCERLNQCIYTFARTISFAMLGVCKSL
ncbi:hypothetical protein NGK83_01035 [Serratia fonticola]|nr:hypothetical protein [Serratia fonticola]MEB7883163.1 hypothetical protein [Serratia fonticola]